MAFWEITLKSIAKSQCEDIHGKVLLFHVTHAYVLLLLVYYYYTHALVISIDKAKILNFWMKTLGLTTEWKWKLNNPVNKTSSDQLDLLIYEGDYSILYL